MNRWAIYALFVAINIPSLNADCSCGISDRSLTAEDRNFIVDEHNRYRQLTAEGNTPGQPPAIDLFPNLQWDNSLAAEALKIAETCVFAHVTVNDNRFNVGQNLYLSRSTADTPGSNWFDAVKAWYDEYKAYDYNSNSNVFTATGHYTQVVANRTLYVGCAYTAYCVNNDPFRYNKYYVCNYGPGGNIVGQKPYTAGVKRCFDV